MGPQQMRSGSSPAVARSAAPESSPCRPVKLTVWPLPAIAAPALAGQRRRPCSALASPPVQGQGRLHPSPLSVFPQRDAWSKAVHRVTSVGRAPDARLRLGGRHQREAAGQHCVASVGRLARGTTSPGRCGPSGNTQHTRSRERNTTQTVLCSWSGTGGVLLPNVLCSH
jgi:hypothetical protein